MMCCEYNLQNYSVRVGQNHQAAEVHCLHGHLWTEDCSLQTTQLRPERTGLHCRMQDTANTTTTTVLGDVIDYTLSDVKHIEMVL